MCLLFVSPCVQADLVFEETDLGRAVINENIEDYRKAWNVLENKSIQEITDILKLTDPDGNNFLHRMAKVTKSRDLFAGEMLRFSVVSIELGFYEIIESDNKQGLSPTEVAQKVGNSIGLEYLTIASNMVKNMRKENDPKKNERTVSMSVKEFNFFTGASMILLASGIDFLGAGLLGNDLHMLTSGVIQTTIGGSACYQAVKLLKEYNSK